MLKGLQSFWRLVRHLSGDDAYERYLKQLAGPHRPDCFHAHEKPLTKKAFFKQWQDEKWNGIKRCC
jgi:uncharacterized short protein YbdD (DUF466 family)